MVSAWCPLLHHAQLCLGDDLHQLIIGHNQWLELVSESNCPLSPVVAEDAEVVGKREARAGGPICFKAPCKQW